MDDAPDASKALYVLQPEVKYYHQQHFSAVQYGFATFRGSLTPVSGSLYSFQLTGIMVLPASLVAIITPYSFLAVDR